MKNENLKRVVLTLLILVVGGIFSATVFAKGDKPHGVVKKSTYDFGMVKEDGGPVTTEFTLTNDGGGNLVIIDAKADCGCTRPEFPKAPIASGKSGVIKVTYNPLGRPGGFDKVITVRTNGSPSKIRLKIRGTVVPK